MRKFLVRFVVFSLVLCMFPIVANARTRPDTIAPDVEIIAPTTYLVSGTVKIEGTIFDRNLSHYWFVVVNAKGEKVAGPGRVDIRLHNVKGLYNVSLDWDTTLVPDGIYTIKLEARDKADNKDDGSVHWVKVEVDNILPEPEPEPEPEPIIPKPDPKPISESEPCNCALVVQIRDETGNAINGAVLKVNGIKILYPWALGSLLCIKFFFE